MVIKKTQAILDIADASDASIDFFFQVTLDKGAFEGKRYTGFEDFTKEPQSPIRSMKRKETRVDIYRSKNHCSLVSSPDLPYCMCTVIEFTPGEGILDLLSFDNYYRSPLFASSYSIRVFSFLFFFFFLRFFSLSDSQPDFQFVKIGFFPLIYFTISQLLLVNTWKSYRTRGDNHFNSIRMER